MAQANDARLRARKRLYMTATPRIYTERSKRKLADRGANLFGHYRHYFGETSPEPPDAVEDEYERNNWRDRRMAADLWSKIFCDQV